MPLYFLLFSRVLFRQITLCASFFHETASFTSSFHHQVSPLIFLPLFFLHTSSHATETPSLKCPHKYGIAKTTNLITFYSSRFVIITSFSKLFFRFSRYMSFSPHSLFSPYLYLLPLKYADTSQGLPSHIVKTAGVLFFSTQSQFWSVLLF